MPVQVYLTEELEAEQSGRRNKRGRRIFYARRK